MQLDFDLRGNPRPAPPEPAVMTVSSLTRRVRDLLESGVGEVWVEGEVSNFRGQASGHMYFTLKDASSQLACVLFSGQAAQLRGVKIVDGARMRLFGQVTVYEQRGQYQMIVRAVQTQGAGLLQARFEALKQRLAAEGLFDTARKRPIPAFPQRIGVVTSPTGAAIRDFLHVLHRRQRGIGVVIHPVRVQGRGAADEIARAVRDLGDGGRTAIGAVDVIVLTRGGGSLEDLWEFNEEAVARAIAASPVPVVSAIGHEIDFTISDFVADMRAPTPSAAAEILSADREELGARLRHMAARLSRRVSARMEFLGEQLSAVRRTALFSAPGRALREGRQTLDRLVIDRDHGAENFLAARRRGLERVLAVVGAWSPERKISDALAVLRAAAVGMETACVSAHQAARAQLHRDAALLAALNPKAALERGYTLTSGTDGQILRRAADVAPGDEIMTHFHDGKVKSLVREGGMKKIG